MYPGASARLLAEVARSGHTAIGGLDLELPDGTLRALRLVDGSVTEDAWSSERWTLDADVSEPDLTDLGLDSLLVPGAILRPWRGVRFPDGTEERIPRGVMLLGEPSADLGTGSLSLRGEGRSTAVSLAQLIDPWPIAAGTLLSQAVSDLLADRLPGCPPVRLECDDVTLGETFIPAGADSNPWGSLTSQDTATPGLVFSAGRRLWFDADGVPVLRTLTGAAAPVEMDGSDLTQAATVALSADEAYGVVVVDSNALGDDTPIRSVRTADGALPFVAKRVYFARLDDLAGQDAVDRAADELLAEVTGIRSQVSWEQPPNPALEAGDVVSITGGPLQGTFEIARIITPLREGLQQVTAVERVL